MCFSPQRRAIFRQQNVKKCSEDYSFFNILTSKCAFRHSGVQFFDSRTSKSAPKTTVFNILTSKCAFRHSGVHFVDGWRAKSASELTCFVHFHLKMCFSPQRRAFCRRVKSKKCFGADVFCTFSLENVLFATAACNFATSELQKVLRDRQFCSIFTAKSAFRHSGVQFLMSPLSTYLRTALTGLLLDWPDTRIYEKTQHFVTSLTFGADVSSFF